jgi:hypothetical protein
LYSSSDCLPWEAKPTIKPRAKVIKATPKTLNLLKAPMLYKYNTYHSLQNIKFYVVLDFIIVKKFARRF